MGAKSYSGNENMLRASSASVPYVALWDSVFWDIPNIRGAAVTRYTRRVGMSSGVRGVAASSALGADRAARTRAHQELQRQMPQLRTRIKLEIIDSI